MQTTYCTRVCSGVFRYQLHTNLDLTVAASVALLGKGTALPTHAS